MAQTDAYRKGKHRLALARAFVEGATFNMLKNMRYYNNREHDIQAQIDQVEALRQQLPTVTSVEMLMGIEGNCRQTYYSSFDVIVTDFAWEGRKKRPLKTN